MHPLVIGVGNNMRGDDGVGRLVARLVRERGVLADVIESAGEGTALMESWSGRDVVLIVDALRSGAVPGTVRRIDAGSESIPAFVSTRSSHAFGVREGIELSRSLGTLPSRLTLFLIEGQSFETGAEMSAPVRRSAGDVVERIMLELHEAIRSTSPDTQESSQR
jgi:hydrogenase maturation protease